MSVITDEQSPLFLTTNQTYVHAQVEKYEDVNPSRTDDERPSLVKSLARRLSKVEEQLEINNAVASAGLSFLFVLTTYGYEAKKDPIIMYIELVIVMDLILDWLLFLLVADNRLGYLLKPQSGISYITITSSLYCIFSYNIEFIDMYELQFMKVLSVLKIRRVDKIFV